MPHDDIDALENNARRSAILQLRTRSKVHLEAAIGSLLATHDIREVKTILAAEVDHLEQFG